jgi:hypothetical protein
MIAIAFGGFFGALTMALEQLSWFSGNPVVEAAMPALIGLIFPGILGSMAVSGNAHAFHLWVAAGINGLLYFGLAWVVLRLIASFVKWRRAGKRGPVA